MKREDVIQMAREAGFRASVGSTDKEGRYKPDRNALGNDVPIEWIERLIHLATEKAVAEEMERCAQICDHNTGTPGDCAAAIRARSNT